jgi:hypothetical protein
MIVREMIDIEWFSLPQTTPIVHYSDQLDILLWGIKDVIN